MTKAAPTNPTHVVTDIPEPSHFCAASGTAIISAWPNVHARRWSTLTLPAPKTRATRRSPATAPRGDTGNAHRSHRLELDGHDGADDRERPGHNASRQPKDG